MNCSLTFRAKNFKSSTNFISGNIRDQPQRRSLRGRVRVSLPDRRLRGDELVRHGLRPVNPKDDSGGRTQRKVSDLRTQVGAGKCGGRE